MLANSGCYRSLVSVGAMPMSLNNLWIILKKKGVTAQPLSDGKQNKQCMLPRRCMRCLAEVFMGGGVGSLYMGCGYSGLL